MVKGKPRPYGVLKPMEESVTRCLFSVRFSVRVCIGCLNPVDFLVYLLPVCPLYLSFCWLLGALHL